MKRPSGRRQSKRAKALRAGSKTDIRTERMAGSADVKRRRLLTRETRRAHRLRGVRGAPDRGLGAPLMRWSQGPRERVKPGAFHGSRPRV